LLRRIYDSLLPGGAFLFSEKILEADSDTSRLFNRFYFELKKRNGYSKLEISQKREALENVLIPYRIDENIDLLHEVGFNHINIFFKWYNFASFLATKKA
jgi:tRNA (cmo5U34)-methyltransferase